MSSTFISADRKVESGLASSFMLESTINRNNSPSEFGAAPTTPIKKSTSLIFPGKRGDS